MKKLLLFIIFVVIVYTGYNHFLRNKPSSKSSLSESQESTVQIGNTIYKVEIADDDSERARGLSGRASMAQDQGLLFLFETKDQYAFWMKDMLFPIDIIWIDGDTVVDIDENLPVPLGTYHPRYQPKVPVDKVLEVNAEDVKRNNIQVGQKVIFTLLKPQSSS